MTAQEVTALGGLASAVVAIILLVIGLVMIPRVRNLITDQVEKFKNEFMALEKTAHADILDAIREIREEQKAHRSNPNAHPNLLAVSRLEPKMEDVRVELVKLQVVVDTLRMAWASELPPRRRGKA